MFKNENLPQSGHEQGSVTTANHSHEPWSKTFCPLYSKFCCCVTKGQMSRAGHHHHRLIEKIKDLVGGFFDRVNRLVQKSAVKQLEWAIIISHRTNSTLAQKISYLTTC